MKPFTVGLTGGIGSGKSAVAELFAQRGIEVVDTDAIAHELTRPGGTAIAPIRAAFGDAMIAADGALDRARMRQLVFSDLAAKKKLESILHPLIRAESARRAAAAGSDYVILMVPLLVESGAERSRYQRILVIDCPEELQVERVMQRSGLAAREIRDIIAAQARRDARLAQADDVIDNSGPLAALLPQVERLHEKYLDQAAEFRTNS